MMTDQSNIGQLCLAYLRCSGMAQVQGDTWDRQSEAIDTYAADHALTVHRQFCDEGVSGTKELADRPALQLLYLALEDTGIKTVIIEKLDRLARDLMVQETILADLQKIGITLISVMEPDLCSSDPSRILVRQIFGAIAQYDRAILVLKLRGARQRVKARKGRCEGQKPYGHYPGEAPTLALIRELRALGHPCHTIAQRLNAGALLTRGGALWHKGVIAKIVRRDAVGQSCA